MCTHTHTSTYTFFLKQWTVIADHIIHGYAHGKGHTSIDRFATNFFGKDFLRRGIHHSVSKLTYI
jgi:hypothetical protein